MAGFLASSESSPSPEQMEFHGNFLSEWNFLGILFGGLLARIAEYLLNGILRDVKFHTLVTSHTFHGIFVLIPWKEAVLFVTFLCRNVELLQYL